jgi:PAS domain S-box-containing protein
MKNKTNQIAIFYILFSLFIAIISFKLLKMHSSHLDYYLHSFLKDIIFIICTGLFFRYILHKNDLRNAEFYKNLKQTNNKIKESNEKYDIVAKATSDTIWDWKIPEDNLTWNKGIKGIFGYKQNQVENNSKWWFSNIHPEDSIKISIKLYSFLEQKTEKWQDQYRFKCANDTYKYVLDRGFILKDENGKAIRMIGVIQDITKQKEEENRLKLLETVFTQAKDSIIITEAKSNEGQIPKIVFANPAYINMTGYEVFEIIGESPNLFMGENSDTNELKKLVNAISQKEESLLEIICYRKDQSEYWVRLSFIPVYNSEHILSHWISIQRDITEEKKAEKEKERFVREITQNNKDLKQFSYITSHNLRSPLSNLIGLLNLTEDIPIEDEELEEILTGLHKSTHLLNETINDLAKVINIRDNSSLLNEQISIEAIFHYIFNQLHFQIELYKPDISINFGNITTIHTNKVFFESIILNLLTNSIKYRSKNRKLTIKISTVKTNNAIIIVFKDNGIGIDLKRNKDKIFGLYQRFHNYPDSKGLGLYLVKSQIESMGGTIDIESEVNKGTTFTLTLKA